MFPPAAGSSPALNVCGGGAARRFASVRHFHRGSQAEATLRRDTEISESDQRLAESRSGRGGFPAGSQGSHLPERHPTTGAMQLVEVRERVEEVEIFHPKDSLLSCIEA